MTIKQSIASTVLLWLIGVCSAQAALITIELAGNGGNLGHTTTFSGTGGVALEVHGFGGSEALLLVASDTNGVPDIGQFDVLTSISGFAGNPDAFTVPAFGRAFLHVLSNLAQPETRVRISSITVSTPSQVPEGGSSMLLVLGLASLVYLRRTLTVTAGSPNGHQRFIS